MNILLVSFVSVAVGMFLGAMLVGGVKAFKDDWFN